jgi:acyl-homoserine-lactone acylase
MLKPLCLAAAAFLMFAPETRAPDPPPRSASASSDTVNVAPPTGEGGAGVLVLQLPGARSTGEWARIQALETAVADLERDWGTAFVAWGEINRLQRPVNGAFSDERPSTPVAGSSGLFGLLHEFNSMPTEGQKRWYGRGGNSYVSVVEFGPKVGARTVIPFGQSADPTSPHYRDQSEIYGRGEFKPAWTALEEVRANAVRSYRPGEKDEFPGYP